ncbi:hypothetical protein A1OE_747 [Candidatus Endolissoclinum faulkneri L2]|uniref:Uncharacterized protein n=1 Tax=Candidatus Endolissoclinum faulkneri L2 TaxID=1193729 RepID=K7Z4L7_9PROT|nr:hypothetical protein A1OE_747 [Candidatus Endolissoclinum faulkneri L2]
MLIFFTKLIFVTIHIILIITVNLIRLSFFINYRIKYPS